LAVIGPSLTISGMTTGPVFAEAGLASIVPTAHGDDVPNAPTTFQPIFNTGQIGAALANYLFYVLQGRRAVLLYTDDAYGRTLSAGFRRTAERLGVEATYHGFGAGPERAKALADAAAEPDHPAVVLGMSRATPSRPSSRSGGPASRRRSWGRTPSPATISPISSPRSRRRQHGPDFSPTTSMRLRRSCSTAPTTKR